jgi:signal transduction histidine kinase
MQQAVNQLEDTECFILEWGVDRQMEVGDGLYTAYLRSQSWEESFKGDCILAALCGFVALLALVWLLYAAGHVAGYEGIHLNTFERFPQDLMLAAVVFGMMVLLSLAGFFWDDIHLYDVIGQSTLDRYLMCAAGALQVAVAILLCLPLVTCSAVQLKDHSFWRRTLLGHLTRWMGALLRLLPAAWRAVGGYLLLTLIVVGGAFLLLTWGLVGDWVLVLLLILWITGLGLVIRWSGGWQRLRESGQALAEGDLTWQTDLRGLPREMQRHGENLNAVSHTIEQAVEQQMKSDRFRTELITNVSHDLKTPLTSIINYVDLLKKLDLPEPEARAYLEVLDRKSQRLKTLTEDLVEASKASAGVLPVNKTRLEVGELLRQAVGEYEDKLHAAQLEARISTPAEPVWIMADGRHTWRILDNLLSNCSKYAMPGTRVYVEAQKEEGTVAISVKNISADPLNVPAEELLERFVRGDSSRTTEGSGLGLSIAQSLATLQGATLTLEVDGDLFKATLRFPEAGEEAPSPDSTADEILS